MILCNNFNPLKNYEGLWTSFFVKPLAYFLLSLGRAVKNYGLSVIIISLIIRTIAFPITRKTAMQSELMKKAQPELNKLQKKYDEIEDKENSVFKLIYSKNGYGGYYR